MNLRTLTTAALVFTLTLGALPARAQEAMVVDRAAVQQALAQRAQSDDSARASIRELLARDDVKAMAGGMGLDVRSAANAVSTLEGARLQQAAADAATAKDILAGGRTTVEISLVALLLIVIIIILLAN